MSKSFQLTMAESRKFVFGNEAVKNEIAKKRFGSDKYKSYKYNSQYRILTIYY